MKRIYSVAAALICSLSATAQTNPTPQSLPYSENFTSTIHTSTVYPAGWQGWTVTTTPGGIFNTNTPTTDRLLVASSSASVNSGNVHNYDGKIGFLNTGSLDLSLVLAINTTNKSNIQLTYDIMTIRNPYDTTTNTRVNEVTLQYRVGTSGSFTTLTGMEYQNNNIKQTGTGVTTPQNALTRVVLLPSACDSEAVVQLRWISRQVSGGGARPSFALDNISVDMSGAKQLSLTTTGNAMEGVSPVAGSFNIQFNPATAATTTLNYAITGTAVFGTDYTVSLSNGAMPATLVSTTGTITVPSGQSSIVASLMPIDDAMSEGMETVVLTLSNASDGYGMIDSVESMNITDDEATFIHMIQGIGDTAIPGNFTVEGVVTGVYPTLSPAGFYLQEEDTDADADINTSEGIFVESATVVSVGDKVRVSGTVLEGTPGPSFQQAVIHTTTVNILSSGNALPLSLPVALPVTTPDDFEKYECMLVKLPDTLMVTDNYNLGRYGEINLSKGGMVYQPTQLVDPNDSNPSDTMSSGISNVAAIDSMTFENNRRTILLDDGRGVIPTLPYVNSDSTLRLGSTINNLTGIMGFAFSKYRIQPIPSTPPVFNYAVRPSSVPGVGNANVKIASFNVLNYFNGDGTGGGFPTARGAHSLVEFNRQRDKIIHAIADINADVVGVIEMENDGIGVNSAIQDLVNGLNAQMGAGTYAIINDGATIQQFGADAIRCGIIYKASAVNPVGAAMLSSNAVFNRPPLAQTFSMVSNGQKFNYVINHFKSKSCSGSSGADVDMLDGQSCYNQTRKLQAAELVNFVNNSVIPASGTSNVLSMGDYNAYYQEDPLDIFRALGYHVLGSGTSYSYLFNGLVGSLDNAIVTDSLMSKVTGIAKWNINSAEPVYLDYNDVVNDGGGDFSNQWGGTYTDIPFRSSDHDPVIVGLDLSTTTSTDNVQINPYKVFPNPADDLLNVETFFSEKAYWQISNITGSIVLKGNFNSNNATETIRIKTLNLGIYFLSTTTETGVRYTTRFVKQ